MDEELRNKLESLKFEPHGVEAMKGRVDDVHYTAVVHPLKGLALLVTHRSSRSISEFEVFIPKNSSVQQIAQAMTEAYEKIHPEKKEARRTQVNSDHPTKEPSAEQRHQEFRRAFGTPGGYILISAYTWTDKGDEVMRKRFPQVSDWPNDSQLGDLLIIGTIISALIQVERNLGPQNYANFHMDLVKEIAPSVRKGYLKYLQGLTCFLLQANRSSLDPEELPSLASLLAEDETKLANSIGVWMVLNLSGKEAVSDGLHFEVAVALGDVAFKRLGKQIASELLGKENLVKSIA